MKIALMQMASSAAWEENCEKAHSSLKEIDKSCDLAVFPENVLCLGNGATVRQAAKPADQLMNELKTIAGGFDGAVIFGGVPVLQNGRVRNASIALAPDGSQLARYDKIHLFQLDTDADHGVDESAIYAPGSEPGAFLLDGWQTGLTICYDLRFPELYRQYAPADLIVCTAAFTRETGAAHWHVLLRARAVENQCFVAGVGQCGSNPDTGMPYYGHSVVVDPWGDVIADAGPAARPLTVELDRKRILEVRKRLPALKNRRL